MEIQCLKLDNAFFNPGLNAYLRAHLGAVKSNDFLKERNSQQTKFLHDKEVDERKNGYPDDDNEHAKKLPSKEFTFLLIVGDQSTHVVEDADSDKAPHTGEAMHLRGFDRVVDIDGLVQFAGQTVDDTSDKADDEG